jgi:hypothetical protein
MIELCASKVSMAEIRPSQIGVPQRSSDQSSIPTRAFVQRSVIQTEPRQIGAIHTSPPEIRTPERLPCKGCPRERSTRALPSIRVKPATMPFKHSLQVVLAHEQLILRGRADRLTSRFPNRRTISRLIGCFFRETQRAQP